MQGQLHALLRRLAPDVEPTAEQLLEFQAESPRRAYYGLPVRDALATFRIGARRLWDELRAAARGTAAEDTAVELVAPLWMWVQSVSGVVADAFADEAGSRYGREAGLRQRFLELLRTGGAPREHTAEIARERGFDPDGDFRALRTPAAPWAAITQRVGPAELATRVINLSGDDARVGVGLDRSGLAGSEMSIADAERALTVASQAGRATSFEDVWLQASLSDSRERLQPLFAEVRQVAGEQALLAETVIVFADSGSSLMERGGIATAEEIDVDTLRARMARACKEVQATVYVPEIVAAWAEVRQHLRLRGELDNAGRKTAAVWASCLPHTHRCIVFR